MPAKSSTTNVPHPAGITAPENENAKTVEFPAEIVNPLAVASPPAALRTDVPSTLN